MGRRKRKERDIEKYIQDSGEGGGVRHDWGRGRIIDVEREGSDREGSAEAKKRGEKGRKKEEKS